MTSWSADKWTNAMNFTFEGHKIDRHRGVRVLNHEELQSGDVSLEYVSKLMQRRYTDSPTIRKVLANQDPSTASGILAAVGGESPSWGLAGTIFGDKGQAGDRKRVVSTRTPTPSSTGLTTR